MAKYILDIPDKTIAHIRADYGHGVKWINEEDRKILVELIYNAKPNMAEQTAEWIETKKSYPKKEGSYLCYHETAGIGFYSILQYVKDLYDYDKFDFPDKKGKSGFIDYDSEYGNYEVTVEAWTEIPKYKK